MNATTARQQTDLWIKLDHAARRRATRHRLPPRDPALVINHLLLAAGLVMGWVLASWVFA